MSLLSFQLPDKIVMEKADDFHGIFTFSPLQPGYGLTIGNAVRRVLLSSLEGYAVTGIKIPGIQHEFSTIDGIVEDVSEIILNLKNVRFKATGENPEKSIIVKFDSKGTLTAQSIEKSTSSFKVLNPKQEICTLSKKVKFTIELRVEKGRGYVTSEENNANSADVDFISVDSVFTPIINVKYNEKIISIATNPIPNLEVQEVKYEESLHKGSIDDITKKVIQFGEKPFRAKQVYDWIWKKGVTDFDQMSNLSISLRKLIKENFIINAISLKESIISNDGTIKNAFELFDGSIIEGVLNKFEGPKFSKGIAEENIQSRLRGLLLMAVSNRFGKMVLATGNKSEYAVGYATLYGDMCGGYAPLKDVWKTDVFKLSKWRNKNYSKKFLGPKGFVMPDNIISKSPSAELRDNQKDTDSLPDYEVLDEILKGLVEKEVSIEKIISNGFQRDDVEKVSKLLSRSEYKRFQSAPGPKVTSKAFGRDRRFPLTSGFKNWH